MNLRIAIFVSTPQTCPLGQGGCISTRRAEAHQAKILFVGCDHHQRWIRSQTEVTCFQTVGVWGVIAWMASGVDTPGFIVHSMFNSLFNSGQALLNETPMPLQMSNHIAFWEGVGETCAMGSVLQCNPDWRSSPNEPRLSSEMPHCKSEEPVLQCKGVWMNYLFGLPP